MLFALAPISGAVVAGVGAITALFAATIALKQWDIKRVLAYSTISQLGYMFVGVGTGAMAAGIFHLVTHAFFKALLFLGSGSVIYAMHHAYHATHSHEDAQDMRNMGGLRRHMPWTAALMWIATLAIAGVPPFSGFFSKDEILAAAFARGTVQPAWLVFWGLGLAAALLTAFYMTRLMIYTFHGPNRSGSGAEAHLSTSMEWTLVAIAVAVAVTGIVGAWRLLKPEALVPARAAPAERGLARVLRNKWYVDELYDFFIVHPLVWLSREVLWKQVDQRVIDGAGVNGAARGARALGWLGARLQTGQVGVYVTLFVVGVLAILWRLVGGGGG